MHLGQNMGVHMSRTLWFRKLAADVESMHLYGLIVSSFDFILISPFLMLKGTGSKHRIFRFHFAA